jgi:hypothetical protein
VKIREFEKMRSPKKKQKKPKKREEKLEKATLGKVEPDNAQVLRGSPPMGGKNE